MDGPTTPATLRDLIREGNRFTDRDLMSALGVGHGTLKRCEADSSLFSMANLLVLATLTGHPLQRLVELVSTEMAHNPHVATKVEQAKSQVVGRKIAPAGFNEKFQLTPLVAAPTRAEKPNKA